MKRFFGILLFLIGVFVALGGWLSVQEQYRANTIFVPTPAWIDSASVEVHHGSRNSTTYEPKVSYHYAFNGEVHHSDRVLPYSEDGGSSWAHDIVDRFRDKQTFVELPNDKPPAIAYVDPENPDQAVLVRQYSFSPYFLTILSGTGAAVGLGMLTGFFRATRTTMAAIAVDDSDSRLLLPTVNLRGRSRSALTLLIAAVLCILPPFYHWIFVARQIGATGGSWVAMILSGIFLGVVLVTAVRRWSLARHISDARLRVRPVPMVRGEPFDIALEADALSPLRVKEAACRVVCIEHYKERRGNKTYYGTRTHRENKIVLSGPAEIPAGQVLAGNGTVRFDPDSPTSSGTAAKNSYPRYTWEARVNIELIGMVDYTGVFPIDVQ